MMPVQRTIWRLAWLLFLVWWTPRSAADDVIPYLAAGGSEYLAWGKELYRKHCAACHGVDGAGNGPAAESMKTPPPDLTGILKRNRGVFPRLEVVRFIEGERPVSAHGSKEMPIWGRTFSQSPRGSTGASPEIYALTDYIQSIQKK
jgi:mono/diheme cytochrome c family protein